ncbi:MAG: DUF368 domain-containing protein [Myxococcota bacterium]|nr:DUF368 domain-containing protein [Myxococcota bacterium]
MSEQQPARTQGSPQPARSLSDALGLFLRGMAMGAADVVPGVSGGTIAFITGIYARFINALKSLSPAFLGHLARGQLKAALTAVLAMHWHVLIPVGLGVAVAIVGLSKLITGLMSDEPGSTYAFFFGLILASAWIPLARMRTRRPAHLVALIGSAVAAWAIVGLQPDGTAFQVAAQPKNASAVFYAGKLRQAADIGTMAALRDAVAPQLPITVFDPKGILSTDAGQAVSHLITGQTITEKSALNAWLKTKPSLVVLEETRSPLWWVFLCGLIAISAMVLPGLSGSFLLLFLGQYHAVFSALHQCLGHVMGWLGKDPKPLTALTDHAWSADFIFCAVFGVGVLIGLAGFSRVVSWLFERSHDLTMAALTGLMIGALRLPGDVVLAETSRGNASWSTVLIIGVVGAIIVSALGLIDQRRIAQEAATS